MDEFDAFHHVTEQAFHEGPPSERARTGMLRRHELDRTLAAFDGSTPVSSAATCPALLAAAASGSIGKT